VGSTRLYLTAKRAGDEPGARVWRDHMVAAVTPSSRPYVLPREDGSGS